MGLLSFLFGKPKLPIVSPSRVERAAPPPRNQSHIPLISWRDGSYPMEVVGESNYQAALLAICGKHTRYGHDGQYMAVLKLEPTNRYDRNAVQVLIDDRLVGYLARDEALRLKTQMDEAGLTAVRCRARIRGGWRTNQYDEGSYGVTLAMPTMGWIDLGIGAERPAPKKPQPKPVKTVVENGPLSGERIAFMGESQAPHLAEQLEAAGARIMATVGTTTTILVVVSPRPFTPGLQSSAKYKRAVENGVTIVSAEEIRARISAGAPPLLAPPTQLPD